MMYARVRDLLNCRVTLPVCTQDGGWHALLIKPFLQLEILSEQFGSNRQQVDPVIDSSLERQHTLTVAKGQHADRHAILQDDLAVRTRLWVSHNFLIFLTLWTLFRNGR